MAAYQSISVDQSDDDLEDRDDHLIHRAAANGILGGGGGGATLLPPTKGILGGGGLVPLLRRHRRFLGPAFLALLGAILASVAYDRAIRPHSIGGGGDDGGGTPPRAFADVKTRSDLPPDLVPPGVNLASWLSLEDWFFVGSDGAVEVASPDDSMAASCLPPLHLDSSTGPRWNSETDLLAGLAEHYSREEEIINANNENDGGKEGNPTEGGGSSLGGWGKAIRAIHAHRSSYYDMDDDLRTMAELGIRHVRVPVSWCWTDHDPSSLVRGDDPLAGGTTAHYMSDADVKAKFACEDPFYDGVYWPAIPRDFFRRFLRKCAKYGIGATIDLHTYPGGTSIGTFSGVWPRYSRFWTHGDEPATEDGGGGGGGGGGGRSRTSPDVGRTLLRDFIGWIESLETSDPMAFRG